MEIAYLILCHKNIMQLKLLINQLANEYTDVYIQVDSKFGNIESLREEDVTLVDDRERVDVRWASFSMTTATLNLINKCLSSGRKYDYVFLISGQDFPIKNIMNMAIATTGDHVEHDVAIRALDWSLFPFPFLSL